MAKRRSCVAIATQDRRFRLEHPARPPRYGRGMPRTAREIQLAARPVGAPAEADFRLAEVAVPEPGDGQVLVRNTWMSVDPTCAGA